MAGYTSLAYVYDALTENADYPARCNVLCDLLAAHGAGEGILLDLACGTGTLTALLAKRGYDVIGVDASQDMLSLAQQKGTNAVFLCQRIEERDVAVVDADLLILIIHDVRDRVADAETGQQQRRAAADADDHHHHALLIQKDVADGDLAKEIQPVPDDGDPFEQHAFARLRRFGADELRRGFVQFPAYRQPRNIPSSTTKNPTKQPSSEALDA